MHHDMCLYSKILQLMILFLMLDGRKWGFRVGPRFEKMRHSSWNKTLENQKLGAFELGQNFGKSKSWGKILKKQIVGAFELGKKHLASASLPLTLCCCVFFFK